MVSIVMLTFFVISFLTNIIGPLIPDMITGFSLSLTLVAILPFAFFIAYGVMSIPAGMLIEKFNEKKIMVAAFVVAFRRLADPGDISELSLGPGIPVPDRLRHGDAAGGDQSVAAHLGR